MAREKLRWLSLFVLALAALIVLAPAVDQIELAPGHLSLLREKEEGLAAGATGQPLTPSDLVSTLFRVLGILVFVFLPVSLVYVLISPDARKRVLRSLVLLFWLAAVLVLLRNRPELLQQLQPETQFGAPIDDSLMPTVQFSATPPGWLVTFATIAFAILVATGIVALAWYVWSQSQRPTSSLDIIAREAEQSLGELQSGSDPQDTIMRCYLQMSRVVAKDRGLMRQDAVTPREFEQHLEDAGLPRRPVKALTRLFESVRYGAKLTNEHEEHQAVAALSAIAKACRSAS